MTRLRSPFLARFAPTALGLAITLGLGSMPGSSPADAGPDGGSVAAGSAGIRQQGAVTTITQSTDRAMINWRSFNLGAGETVRFIQPSATSITANRVVGGDGPSSIYGTLTANGRVFLINPEGVLFGYGAVIDTAGFLATTHDIKNDDFMNAKNGFAFTIPGNPSASIVNLGTITATSGGIAALVAPGVRNAGTITADLGKVALVSGNGFTLDLYGDKLITLQVGDQIASQVKDVATGKTLDALVKNEGVLRANGGRVELSAAAARQVVDAVINTTGVIEANTVGTRNGMIVLGAATAASKGAGMPAQTVKVSGRVSAAGKNAGEKGGKVQIAGENIALAGATIDASGRAGGGRVVVGGDVGGGNGNAAVAALPQAALETTPVPTAATVSVDTATLIDVSARDAGSGGKLVVWSDVSTSFSGTFQARGGNAGGDGGFAEISSKGHLSYNGVGDLRAPAGGFGTLLLDPYDITISVAPDSSIVSGGTFSPTATSNLNIDTLQDALANGNVVVTTGATGSPGGDQGNITLLAPLNWTAATSLTLHAANDIALNAAVDAPNGGLALWAGNAISAPAAVNVGTFTLQHGNWSQVSATGLPGFAATDFRIAGGSFLRALGGDGSGATPYRIADSYGLQGIGSSPLLSATNYVLANDIDAGGTANWNAGAGFISIGAAAGPFTGSLDGQGHAITGLTIGPNGGPANPIGLFATIGAGGRVQGLTLRNVSVAADASGRAVGALAGVNQGTVSNVSVESAGVRSIVAGGQGAFAGGLIGRNSGLVSNVSADVDITVGANGIAGGLAGANAGTIDGASASGAVGSRSTDLLTAGGLVGINTGGISNAQAHGNVSAGDGGIVGGLVGRNRGSLDSGVVDYGMGQLVAVAGTGNVSVGNDGFAGGLVGVQDQSGSIQSGYSLGAVTGQGTNSVLGGLVGSNAGWIAGGSHGLPASAPGPAVAGGGVVGGSKILIGGLVGNNAAVAGDALSGLVQNAYVNSAVTGTGTGNTVGGLVGSNSGTIDGGTVSANVASGATSMVGPVVGVLSGAGSIANITFAGTWLQPPTPIGAQLVSNKTADPSADNSISLDSPGMSDGGQDDDGQGNGKGRGKGRGKGKGRGGGNSPASAAPPPGSGIGRTPDEQRLSGAPPTGEMRFVPGEVVVQISKAVSPDRIAAAARALGLAVIDSRSLDAAGRTIYRFAVGRDRSLRDVVIALERNQIVASAQPNYVFRLAQDILTQDIAAPSANAGTPVDPALAGGPTPSPELSGDLQADMAARVTLPAGDAAQYTIDKLPLGAVHPRTLGRNVTVAVIDSEIDIHHPDLVGVVAEQFDATGTASNPHAHGTGMAGAIASKRRLLGVAPGVRIVAVKAFDETASNAEATSYQLLKGLEWAIDKRVRIINMSFAGPRDLMMERLLQKAFDQGTVLIAAAGNAGPKSTPLYPAADPNVIAVSATDHADRPFRMANRGRYIAVAAPGVDVLVPAPNGHYQLTTGTSVAAAHVSGVAALLLERLPTLTPRDVRTILTTTAHAINPKGPDEVTGAGLVDPYQALMSLTVRPPEGPSAGRMAP